MVDSSATTGRFAATASSTSSATRSRPPNLDESELLEKARLWPGVSSRLSMKLEAVRPAHIPKLLPASPSLNGFHRHRAPKREQVVIIAQRRSFIEFGGSTNKRTYTASAMTRWSTYIFRPSRAIQYEYMTPFSYADDDTYEKVLILKSANDSPN